MTTYLDVPFAEKDDAKNLGAKWDHYAKRWYAPEGVALDQLQQWIPAYLYLVFARQACWKCNKETKLVAIGIPYGDASLALQPRLECMPYEMRKYILDRGVNYHAKNSKTTGYTELNNCCEHCDTLQGEFFLFDDFGPFMPTSVSAMQNLEFCKVELPSSPQGEVTSWSSLDEELFKYAAAHNRTVHLGIVETIRV